MQGEGWEDLRQCLCGDRSELRPSSEAPGVQVSARTRNEPVTAGIKPEAAYRPTGHWGCAADRHLWLYDLRGGGATGVPYPNDPVLQGQGGNSGKSSFWLNVLAFDCD